MSYISYAVTDRLTAWMNHIEVCFQQGYELWTKLPVNLVEGFPDSMLQKLTRGPTYNEVPMLPHVLLQEFRYWAEAIIFLNYHPPFTTGGSGHMNNATLEGESLLSQAHQFPHASLSTCCGSAAARSQLFQKAFVLQYGRFTDCCTLISGCRNNGHLVGFACKCQPTAQQF